MDFFLVSDALAAYEKRHDPTFLDNIQSFPSPILDNHLFLRFLRLPLLLHVSRIANKDNLLQLADDFSSLS